MSILDALNPYTTLIKVGMIVLVLGTVFGLGAKWNGDRWERKYTILQTEYQQFKGGVAALGEAAKAKAAKENLDNLRAKERADALHDQTLADMRGVIARMRVAATKRNPGGNTLPAAPAGASRPDLATFDRAELESAFRRLLGEVRGLVDEGSQATIDLNTAKQWAGEVRLKLSTTLKE